MDKYFSIQRSPVKEQATRSIFCETFKCQRFLFLGTMIARMNFDRYAAIGVPDTCCMEIWFGLVTSHSSVSGEKFREEMRNRGAKLLARNRHIAYSKTVRRTPCLSPTRHLTDAPIGKKTECMREVRQFMPLSMKSNRSSTCAVTSIFPGAPPARSASLQYTIWDRE